MFKKCALVMTLVGASFTAGEATMACGGGSCGAASDGCTMDAASPAPTLAATRGNSAARRFSYEPGRTGASFRAPMYRGRGYNLPPSGVRGAEAKVLGRAQ